jgi:deoxyribodipyrimidine photo-lyase
MTDSRATDPQEAPHPLADGPAPSRAAGLRRLADFAPRSAEYARHRNFDLPPHRGVSRLSPWLRHRLVLESEAVAAAWAACGPEASERFTAEVLWRTYWKGWLQLRPQVWEGFLEDWRRDRDALSGAQRGRYEAVLAARSGIDCLNAWVAELTGTGYLHNHARMWLASIWIFTLRLPWSLGAAFFLRHLLDGDPASNTLSWRWVAGLHTSGKHYLARAENIARFTGGRFDPRGLLNEAARPLSQANEDLAPRPLAAPGDLDRDRTSVLLITPEDLTPEHSPLAGLPVGCVLGGWDRTVESELDLAPRVAAFTRRALEDGLDRAEAAFAAPRAHLDGDHWLEDARERTLALGVDQVVTLEAPVGPWRRRLDALGRLLEPNSVRLVRVRRPWDQALWPGATHGFFRLRRYAAARGRLRGLVRASPEPAALCSAP